MQPKFNYNTDNTSEMERDKKPQKTITKQNMIQK